MKNFTTLLRLARRGTVLLSATALALFASAPAARPDTPAPKITSATVAEKPAPKLQPSSSYMRFVRLGEDDYAMQLAVRSFKPATGKGPRVTLVSAVHIGASAYYARLQEILDARKLLLFEGVADTPDALDSLPAANASSTAPESDTLYDHIAKAAGLTTQMAGINYNRKHFRGADLSMREMRQRLQAEAGQGGTTAREAKEALRLMREVEGMLRGSGGFSMLLVRGIFGVIGSSPQFRTLFLYQLGTVEDKENLFTSGWTPPGLRRLERLLLDDRNEHAMGELKKVLSRRRPPKDVGVFYGGAHLRGMEKILTEQMGYKLEKTEWLTAFTMHPAAAGLPKSFQDNFARRAAKDSAKGKSTTKHGVFTQH